MDTVLFGRERERALLERCVREAAHGRGGVVLLAGEAGIGKTALARAVLGAAQLQVLEGAALPGATPAFGPLAHALAVDVTTAALTEGSRVADEAASALERVSEAGPTAVFLDDLHWADDATLELLPGLARWATSRPVLLVGAFRSDELPRGSGVRRLRAELRHAGLLRQVTLEALDAEATRRLLEATLGRVTSRLATAVLHRTDGIPFFATELAAALAASGCLRPTATGLDLPDDVDVPLPESVRDAVLLAAADLSDPARDAALAAAVAGQVFDPELVADVAGLPEWPDELARRGLVVESGPGRMAFRHALVRDAFYAETPWTRRAALHRAVAERLAAADVQAAAVAEHWLAGRRPDLARAALLAAAGAHASVHANRDAARALRRALELWPEGEDVEGRLVVLERLAGCWELAGGLGEATGVWRELADLHEQAGHAAGVAHASRRLAAALELQGRWQEGLASRERAALAFTSAGEPGEAAAERLTAAAHLRSAGSFRAALALLELAGPDARAAARHDLGARVLGLEGNVRARMGEGARGVTLVRAGLALALDHGATSAAAEVYQRLADSLEHGGDYSGARETYDEAHSFCATNGLEPNAQLCLACLASVLRQSGDWERAAAVSREIIDSEAAPHPRTVATGMLGSILVQQGRPVRGRPLLLESLTLARRIELAAMELLSLWGLALADAGEGRLAAAAGHCRALLDRWRRTEDRHYVVSPLRWSVTFLAQVADPDAARACAGALAELAAPGDVEAMSALSHALGELALLEGDPGAAAEHFGRALAQLQGVEAPFDRAETGRRLAAALVLLGRSAEAVEQLVAARRTARRLGAVPLEQQLAADLAALGERPDRRDTARGLSRREVEVVRLVAAGCTNREIARELFLSPRTVEMHVSSILGKLDCRSRADATRRAAELGLLASSA